MDKKIIIGSVISFLLLILGITFGLLSTNNAKKLDKCEEIDLNMLWKQPLSLEFIQKHEKLVDWHLISKYASFSQDLIRIYMHRINMTVFLTYHKLNEDLLEEIGPYLDWNAVSRYQILSSCFIREHLNSLNLKDVLKYQKLTPSMQIYINKQIRFND